MFDEGFCRRCAGGVPETYVYLLRMWIMEKLAIDKMRGKLIYGAPPLTDFDLKSLPNIQDDWILWIEYYYPLYAYYQVTGRMVIYDS